MEERRMQLMLAGSSAVGGGYSLTYSQWPTHNILRLNPQPKSKLTLGPWNHNFLDAMNVGQSVDIYASSILADSSPSRLLRITRDEDDNFGDSKYSIAPFTGSNTYNIVWGRLVLISYPVVITSTLNNIEGSRSLTSDMDIAGPFGPAQMSMFSEKIIFDYMYPFLISCSPDIGHIPFVGGMLEFLDE